MDMVTAFRGLSRATRWRLICGVVLLVVALAGRSVLFTLIAAGLLISPALTLSRAARTARTSEPWPWPDEFRSLAEGMARAIDPTPKRLLPAHEKASTIAAVATTGEALSRLITDKPPAWPWAIFASVLVQRRNALTARLRRCASGYQPRPGVPEQSGPAYSHTARAAMDRIADLVGQTNQFMLSPAFTGAFGDPGVEGSADADAIVAAANRLMDYHEAFLSQAEVCLQTPVRREVLTFVHDVGAFTLCPLLGYEQFIPTMCARIGEAQDLLPYTRGGQVVALDDVTLVMEIPDGLTDRIVAQFARFTAPS